MSMTKTWPISNFTSEADSDNIGMDLYPKGRDLTSRISRLRTPPQLCTRCDASARRRKSSDSPCDFVPHGTFKRCTLQGNRVDSPGKRSACPITSPHGFRIISSVRFVRFRTKAVGNRDGHGLDPTRGQSLNELWKLPGPPGWKANVEAS